jgi:hypothetical protein
VWLGEAAETVAASVCTGSRGPAARASSAVGSRVAGGATSFDGSGGRDALNCLSHGGGRVSS